MSDKTSAIGVFDSGLGGLTAVKELIEIMPSENIVYFGDTGRVPYGTRSKGTIIKFVRQSLNFLSTFDLKVLMLACGTATATALPCLAREYDVPVIGIIDYAAEAAVKKTKNGKIAIIATPATISSGSYEHAIKRIDQNLSIFSKACPFFVPMIEDGRYSADDPVAQIVIREYLSEVKEFDPGALILGCTHYPLMKEAIAYFLANDTSLIDPGYETAVRLRSILSLRGMLNDSDVEGSRNFYVSDNVYNFEKTAKNFLHRDIGTAQKVDIDAF